MSLHPGTDASVTHRNLLFTVAYEMLGSAADAEDVELAESVSTAMLLPRSDGAGGLRPARGLRPALRRDRRGDRSQPCGRAADRAPGA
ncbi:hypothetical protein ACRTEC_00520 [Janibacter indicus]